MASLGTPWLGLTRRNRLVSHTELTDWLRVIMVVAPLLVGLGAAGPGRAGPEPGDVFREYTYNHLDIGVEGAEVPFDEATVRDRARRRAEIPPIVAVKGEETFFGEQSEHVPPAPPDHPFSIEPGVHGKPVPTHIEIGDLAGAVKAELAIAYWGGHIGTSVERFRVNGSRWIMFPRPVGTPTDPDWYYRTLLAATPVEVPLSQLREGDNLIEFSASKQTRYGFNWSFYWMYSYTVRVYYGKEKPHPTGAITAPAAGARIGDRPTVAAAAQGPAGVKQVDFLARCEDFNYEGDGEFTRWHYVLPYGRIGKHVGTAREAPYRVTWDNLWVPDQESVELAARIVGNDGIICMTPMVATRLARPDRRVVMYRPHDVPENFGVRAGALKACSIGGVGDLSKAVSARLYLSTWSAAHAEAIGMNGVKLVDRVGLVHNYSFNPVPVPVDLLVNGTNAFYLFSSTEEHAAEVNWPGPVLFVEHAPWLGVARRGQPHPVA